ncbi:hypothetical protein BKA61DRAFT_574382 [Leptodontidium sp. MPI-SDFR-AT-0119]|nr:hypothetical protein BKA61DRAFT_574382 [Leptodontidium sp. MPI-SDFR-AT-0119]
MESIPLLALHEIESNHGTVQLISDSDDLQYKDGTSIVLVPQPTRNDPNDPLNWPFAKRVAAFCATGFDTSFRPAFPVVGFVEALRQIDERTKLFSQQWRLDPMLGSQHKCGQDLVYHGTKMGCETVGTL